MRPPSRRRALVLALALGAGLRATAQPRPPAEVAENLPGARLQGSGELRFWGLHVYEARLWFAEQPVAADWASRPFALELDYRRALSGERIAERSLKEMRRQGRIADADGARWLDAMRRMFPDVKDGERITGLNLPGTGVRYYFNGNPCGELRDAAFARLFFGIWLAPGTSEPALREALLGRGAS